MNPKDTESLESIEKEWIEEDLKTERVKELSKRTMKFTSMGQDGTVELKNEAENIALKNKIWLLLVARYLANKLQTELDREEVVSPEVTTSEFADMLHKEKKIISARLSDLKKDGKVKNPSRGVYKANPYKIENLFRKIEKEN